MNKMCGNCPFRRGNQWHYGADGKIEALKEIDRQQIFACHLRNHDNNVFSIADMIKNDCGGFQRLLENIASPGSHPDAVDDYSETNPVYDIRAWANHKRYHSWLLNLKDATTSDAGRTEAL